ncbi:transcription initiation factor IID, 18kD subunit-domain-containing protein [Schizophyllum amplum]|uniref:Transcription initiation factor TFIID subunit 13 n=1 Tax=Schizophyllum amplum TaxID=97359 RepID=A0A550CCE5_9AGAR|nr:transcription initiation factor IID, 18kD subunit-domain-containing protein [Auriculariopsis ampla]
MAAPAVLLRAAATAAAATNSTATGSTAAATSADTKAHRPSTRVRTASHLCSNDAGHDLPGAGVPNPGAGVPNAHDLSDACDIPDPCCHHIHTPDYHLHPPICRAASNRAAFHDIHELHAELRARKRGYDRPRGRNKSNLRGLFTKELRNLMYGFGDDRNPSNDTVNVLEEILIEYITDVCQTAASSSKKSRLSLDDLRKALSRPADAKKLARMEELLFMQEEIKRARAQFESADMEKPPGF